MRQIPCIGLRCRCMIEGRKGRRNLSGCATALLHVVERLEIALPPESEVRIGTIQAAASDILDGLRAYARSG